MPHIIEITDLSAPELDVFARLTEAQLRSRRAPERALFIAESPLVIGRALDAGASTGGFTQVLLERGCAPVYAVDVRHGQLADLLRADPRVVVRERLNLRDLTLADLGGQPVDVVVADVSFISLRMLAAPLLGVLRPSGVALFMVKPQFEVGRAGLDAHGVVTDSALRDAAVDGVIEAAAAQGWTCDWRAETTLPGTGGNREFFVRLRHL